MNVFHVIVIAPLLFYIGYMKKDAMSGAFDATLMLAFAAFGYNLYKAVLHSNTVTGGESK